MAQFSDNGNEIFPTILRIFHRIFHRIFQFSMELNWSNFLIMKSNCHNFRQLYSRNLIEVANRGIGSNFLIKKSGLPITFNSCWNLFVSNFQSNRSNFHNLRNLRIFEFHSVEKLIVQNLLKNRRYILSMLLISNIK